ncbi:MAG TPA: major facilitator superfamily domain-containing protein 6 [Bacillota bacterium]|nr:major facilitator superfamily domain-containing protein 6 [Bacillota bacterium]
MRFGAGVSLRVYYFCYFMIVAGFMPYLPVYLRRIDVSGVEIGALMGIGSLVMIFAQPFWGIVSDHFQAQLRVLRVTLVGAMLAVLLFTLTTKVWILGLITILYMIFQTAHVPISDSIALTYLRNSSNEGFGSIRLWGSLGFSVAVVLMGYVFSDNGILRIFYWSCGLYGVALVTTLGLPTAAPQPRAKIGKLAWHMLKNRRFLVFVGFTCLVQITFNAYNTFFSIYFTGLGATSGMLGLAWMLSALSEIPVFYFGEQLRRRFGNLGLLRFAATVYGIRWLLYAVLKSPELVLASQVLQSISFGVFYLAAVNYVADITPPELITTGQSLFAAVTYGIGSALGSLVGGLLYQQLGLTGMFYSLSGLILVALLLNYRLSKA